jgi:DNA helicase-2/ATP-dependent DNA helicase PcrA
LANQGPVLILAGAGSGKTRAITHKIAWLCEREGYAPWEILAVTFTNKAAGEMRQRCTATMGERARDLWLGTFHSIGVRILRRHGESIGIPRSFTIYDADDQRAVIDRCLKSFPTSDPKTAARHIAQYIERAKRGGLGPDAPKLLRQRPEDRLAAEVYGQYEGHLRSANAVDFSDLIWLPLKLMEQVPLVASEYRQRWRYVLVDEFQDTNHAQYALLRAVLNDAQRICVVGDDDQSIYSWRGAEVGNILGFADDFPQATVIRLEQNYRSTSSVLEAAAAIIGGNKSRHPKQLWTQNPAGERVAMKAAQSERDEALYVADQIQVLRRSIPAREIAIFYRTNAQSRSFEDVLRQRGIPHRVIGGLRFYERMEVKDVLAYLRVVHNPADDVSLERIINVPTRGIGRTTIDEVRALADEHGATFWNACRLHADRGRKAARERLGALVALIQGLAELAAHASALEVVEAVLERTGYLDRLQAENTIEAQTRIENVEELCGAIREATVQRQQTLGEFLAEAALVSDLDAADPTLDAVSLMTVHTAKGLEFDSVFVTGLEEGILPHFNVLDDPQAIEEERRLLYVGMTRARHHLHLTWAHNRWRYGRATPGVRSRFLRDLPQAVDTGARRPRVVGADWEYAHEVPDYEGESQDPGSLRPGARVYHPRFGDGVVTWSSGDGDQDRADVRFAGGEVRRIQLGYLTRL